MKLITTNTELRKNLNRLIKKYPNISFAVAWASAGNEIFELLCKNQNRIHQAVIGTHFYQTHPDVLEAFIESNSVRFILQPKGVFHPKVYIFWSENQWEVLLGSANLTNGALNMNSEAMILVSGGDDNQYNLKEKVLSSIVSYWKDARTMNRETLTSYRALWKKQQPALRRLSGQYGESKKFKAPTDSSVMTMTWDLFLKTVQKDPHHGFEERCELLKLVRLAFEKAKHFSELELGLRKTIAGLPTDFNEHWGWFGSMSGAGYFHQAVNNNNPYISSALDEIPLNGHITRDHYEAYLSEFIKAFPNGGHGIGVASRLLALKRPDYFVCFDSKNNRKLCEDFGIRKSGMDYNRYWEEIIERITDSVWWNTPRPNNATTATVWDGRTAMLDSIYYEP